MNERTLSIFDLARRFDDLNHKALCESVARLNPAVLCHAAAETAELFADVPSWANPVIAHIQDNAMVSAIKTLRLTHTNLSLKDAMQACRIARDGFLDEGSDPSAEAISIGTILAKAMGTILCVPLVKAAKPAPAPVHTSPAAQTAVWLVRYEDDNTVHSLYYSESRANAVCDTVNALSPYDRDGSNRVYVSHFYID